jgi:peptidoglycan/xylan/chitin deacetylase (PgdA/CDA1 family)
MTRLKAAIERLLLAAAPFARRIHGGRVLVLAYHNVVPDGEEPVGDSSLHVPQRRFARQLDLLTQTHDIVPVSALLADATTPSWPRAVVTFDDAYAGAVSVGVSELVSRRIPATIFVAPGLLDGQQFWWDELAGAAGGEMTSSIRAKAVETLAGDAAQVRDSWQWSKARRLPAYATGASLTALTRAASQPGITLGSHSWNHPNLTRVPPARLDEELTRPLAWLRERFSSAIPWLAYPYGLASSSVARAAAQAGYDGAFLVRGGWLPRRSTAWQRHLLPRVNIPAGLSDDGFRLCVSGFPVPQLG